MGQMKENLQGMIEPVIFWMGYAVVGFAYVLGRRRSVFRLYIDKADGFTLDDCSAVSHQVSGLLDVEDPLTEEYNLEVSSPGSDRPLFKLAHYQAFMGHRVKLQLRVPLNNRRKFKGIIKSVEGDEITLVVEDNKEYKLDFNLVERANLVPEEV